MSALLYKQYNGDRHAGVEITNLCWNSKLDLLAIANVKGEIILQRLFWKKAWEYSCPFENCSVVTICWSPNGDCLVVVYSNFIAHFLDLENGKLVHEMKLKNSREIVRIKWLELSQEKQNREFFKFNDILAEFPPLEKVSSSKTGNGVSFSSTFLRDDTKPSLLLFGHENGSLSMYLNGYFHFCSVDINCLRVNVMNFDFSADLNLFCVGYVDEKNSSGKTKCATFSSSSFTSKISQLDNLTRRIGKLIASWQYLENVVKSIIDSWEDILIDVGDKFTKFAKEKWLSDKNATVGDELIILMAFGTASPELQSFLTNDLTEKSLKKLIQTLDNNYQTLRRLLFLNLNSALSSVFYHVSQLREFNDQIDEARQLNAQNVCASASLKAREMYNVVDRSLSQLGSFFNWLQKILSSITEENVPPQSSANNRQLSSGVDVNLLTNFIEENFVKVYDENEIPLFKLEKVGQYLKNENLSAPFARRSTIFEALSNIAGGAGDDGNSCVFELNKNSSLIQEINRLKQAVDELLLKSLDRNINLIRPGASVVLLEETSPTIVDVVHRDSDMFRYFLGVADGVHVVDVDKSCRILRHFHLRNDNYSVIDMSFYSLKYTTLLLENNSSKLYRVVQLNDELFAETFMGRRLVNLEETDSAPFQNVDGPGPFLKLVVCGTRKVGCLLYSCRTRLKLLEMEPDEETTFLSNSSTMDVQ